jgi:hypothetical protein
MIDNEVALMEEKAKAFLTRQGIERLAYQAFWDSFGIKFGVEEAEMLEFNLSQTIEASRDPKHFDFFKSFSENYDILVGVLADVGCAVHNYLNEISPKKEIKIYEAGTSGLIACFIAEELGGKSQVKGYHFRPEMVQLAMKRNRAEGITNLGFYVQSHFTPTHWEWGDADILIDNTGGEDPNLSIDGLTASEVRTKHGGLIIGTAYPQILNTDQITILERNGLLVQDMPIIATVPVTEHYRNIHLIKS